MAQDSASRRILRIDDGQRGHVALLGVVLMLLVVAGIIGFAAWSLSQKPQPVLQYTPPKVSADDALSDGNTTKELFQDVKILDAGIQRANGYKSAAQAAISDQQLPIDDTAGDSVVQQDNLTGQQTNFIAECNRRIKALAAVQPLLDRLTDSQRPAVEQLINRETTSLNSLKSQVAAATNADAFAGQLQALNQEYNAYLLAVSQTNLLVWADDQAVLEDRYNVVGGKFQERINDASNNGISTATAQTALNGYQANKDTAKGLTASVIKVVPIIKPGEQNSNRSVLKTYSDQLSTAHNELTKGLASAKTLALEAQKFDAGTSSSQ